MKKNSILLTGVLSFAALLALSVVYYKERTCFLDIAYHLFYILKDDGFAIQNYRFGAFFTQLFPLAGSRAGMSLNGIAIAYSMSFVALSTLAFLLIHLGLKNSRVSLAYLMATMLMTTHTFFWTQSELPQALAFLFVLAALLDNAARSDREPSPLHWLMFSVLSFIVCFTHPLVLFAFVFLTLRFLLSYPGRRGVVLSVAGMYLSFYLAKTLFFKTPYDSQAAAGINNFAAFFPNYLHLQSNKDFLKYFLRDYSLALFLLPVALGYYAAQRRYAQMMLLFVFFTGYSLLVNISYPNGADQFYLENQYQILSVFLAIPLVWDILPKIKTPNVQLGIVIAICAMCMLRIARTAPFYAKRLDWNRNLLAKTEGLPSKKLIISPDLAPKDTLLMTWASSYEFWLLSTIEKGVSRSIIIEEKDNEFDWALPASHAFISKWGVFGYADFNKRYFIFDDPAPYVKIR